MKKTYFFCLIIFLWMNSLVMVYARNTSREATAVLEAEAARVAENKAVASKRLGIKEDQQDDDGGGKDDIPDDGGDDEDDGGGKK